VTGAGASLQAMATCPLGCTCGRHKRTTYRGKPFVPQTDEERRQYQRDWRAANRKKLAADSRRRYASNGDARRGARARYRDKNREKLRAESREYQRARRAGHALRPGEYEALWEAQDGLCCYCSRPLDGKICLDHDHSCCPTFKSCPKCRRGLAHNNCNVIVGMAGEDWDLLAAIATSGPALVAAVQERIAAAASQGELPFGDGLEAAS
jgi:Recombination endonuclease VII